MEANQPTEQVSPSNKEKINETKSDVALENGNEEDEEKQINHQKVAKSVLDQILQTVVEKAEDFQQDNNSIQHEVNKEQVETENLSSLNNDSDLHLTQVNFLSKLGVLVK